MSLVITFVKIQQHFDANLDEAFYVMMINDDMYSNFMLLPDFLRFVTNISLPRCLSVSSTFFFLFFLTKDVQ